MGSRPGPYEILDLIGADVIGYLPAAGKLEWPTAQALFLRKQMYGVRT
jgi:hypothetical protein